MMSRNNSYTRFRYCSGIQVLLGQDLDVATHTMYGFGPGNNGANQILYKSILDCFVRFSARINIFIGIVAFVLCS
jgi:hypothetical protein